MEENNQSQFGNQSQLFNFSSLRTYTSNKDFFDTINKVAISLNILITVAVLITNLLLLGTILTSPKLRKDVRYMLVVSLSFADLITGGFGLPFYVDFGIQKKISVACHFHVVIQVILIYAHVMITSVGLLIINIHYVIKQYNFRWCDIRQKLELPRNIVIAILPWILTVVIVTPLICTGLHPFVATIWSDNRCPLLLSMMARMTMKILNFFLPMLLVFICTGFIVKGWIASRKGNLAFRPTLLSEEGNQLHPKFLILLNVGCFLLLLPGHVVDNSIQVDDIKILLSLFMVCFQLSLLKSVYFPALWLFTPEVKQHLIEKFKFIFNRKLKVPQYIINKSYKDFTEEEKVN